MIEILATVCLLVSGHVFAESKFTGKYSDSELIQIIKDEGYRAVTKINDGTIRIKIDGRSYLLFNENDGDLRAAYIIEHAEISYEDINEWNRTKRLSRAYIDSDNDSILESDLLANGGLTRRHVTEFFNVFKNSVKRFRKFIVEHDKS